jgi:hypothetical protein
MGRYPHPSGVARPPVNAWLTLYPAQHRDSLVFFLRSVIDNQHRDAPFELSMV